MNNGVRTGIKPGLHVPLWAGGGNPDNDGFALQSDIRSEGGVSFAAPFPVQQSALRATSLLFDTGPREFFNNTAFGFTSQNPEQVAIGLPAGQIIKQIAFLSVAAGSALTHQVFGILDRNLNALAFTADDTSTAWGAQTLKFLNIATTAAGPPDHIVTPYSGLYYLWITVVGTLPTLAVAGSGGGTIATGGNSALPVLGGQNSTSAGSGPPAFPYTSTINSVRGTFPYAGVA